MIGVIFLFPHGFWDNTKQGPPIDHHIATINFNKFHVTVHLGYKNIKNKFPGLSGYQIFKIFRKKNKIGLLFVRYFCAMERLFNFKIIYD
jgi:hypothetical protein